MKFQNNNDAIYRLRQEILSEIREFAAGIAQQPRGTISLGELSPIVTFETDEYVTNARVSGLKYDEKEILEIYLVDVYDISDYVSCGGENIYLEGLNDILDIVETMAKNTTT